MNIRTFENRAPHIASTCYVDKSAVIIGDVQIDEDSSIWPNTVIRGDINSIRIGKRTSIQDGSVMHVTHAGTYHPEGFTTTVGDNVTVGHGVILHGCHIAEFCLIGMGSIVMDGVTIEPYVILGAGSTVTPNKTLEGGYLWLGSPAKRVRKLEAQEMEQIRYSANYYVQLKNRYLTHPSQS